MPIKYCKRHVEPSGMTYCKDSQIYSKKNSYSTQNGTHGIVICHWKRLYGTRAELEYKQVKLDDDYYQVIKNNTDVLTNDEVALVRKAIEKLFDVIGSERSFLSICGIIMSEKTGINIAPDLGVITTDDDVELFAGQTAEQMEIYKSIIRMY